jgi:hypothetical protein
MSNFGFVSVLEASPGYNRIVVSIQPNMLLSVETAKQLVSDLQSAIKVLEQEKSFQQTNI